jgi:hypothetical protein
MDPGFARTRQFFPTINPVCVAMLAIAETGRRDILAEQFTQLDEFRKRSIIQIEKVVTNEFHRKLRIEFCVPDARFQLNVLRLAALRDPKSGDALEKVDAYCRSLNMTTNQIPIVAWNARTTWFETRVGSRPDASKGVTMYSLYDWDGSFLNPNRSDEKRAIVQKVRDLAL